MSFDVHSVSSGTCLGSCLPSPDADAGFGFSRRCTRCYQYAFWSHYLLAVTSCPLPRPHLQCAAHRLSLASNYPMPITRQVHAQAPWVERCTWRVRRQLWIAADTHYRNVGEFAIPVSLISLPFEMLSYFVLGHSALAFPPPLELSLDLIVWWLLLKSWSVSSIILMVWGWGIIERGRERWRRRRCLWKRQRFETLTVRVYEVLFCTIKCSDPSGLLSLWFV